MDNPLRHYAKLCKEIDKKLGKGAAAGILSGLEPRGDETDEEIGEWARALTERLEANIPEEALTEIREECACIKANKYSAYNTKYFAQLRAENPDDEAYLRAVANFMDGRGRCGKHVEYVDGRIISHFGFGDKCVCYVAGRGWNAPPSVTWCRCCQGTAKSVYRFVFPDRVCHMDIIETFATGGDDCVFSTWFSEATE